MHWQICSFWYLWFKNGIQIRDHLVLDTNRTDHQNVKFACQSKCKVLCRVNICGEFMVNRCTCTYMNIWPKTDAMYKISPKIPHTLNKRIKATWCHYIWTKSINVTERSHKLIRDVRLRGWLKVWCYSAIFNRKVVNRLSESVSLSERFIRRKVSNTF